MAFNQKMLSVWVRNSLAGIYLVIMSLWLNEPFKQNGDVIPVVIPSLTQCVYSTKNSADYMCYWEHLNCLQIWVFDKIRHLRLGYQDKTANIEVVSPTLLQSSAQLIQQNRYLLLWHPGVLPSITLECIQNIPAYQ